MNATAWDRLQERLAHIFRWIAEPRVQRTSFFVIYLMHIVAGFGILIGRPDAIEGILGGGLTAAWAGFLIFGGGAGAAAVLPGWNYIERIGILSVLVGVALCSIVIAWAPWSDAGVQVSVWALVTAWVSVFLYRTYEIRLYLIAPHVRG